MDKFTSGLDSKIKIINELSTHVHADKEPHNLPKKGDVLVSEILGTLMLGESALTFVADCRDRLLKPDAQIIPAAGAATSTSLLDHVHAFLRTYRAAHAVGCR